MKPYRRITLLVVAAVMLAAAGASYADWRVPPKPSVPPVITYPVDLDGDLNHLDDALEARLHAIRSAAAAEPDAAARAEILQQLHEPVGVEMLFCEPITAEHLREFEELGGVIEHVFRHVSYGWGGRIPLGQVERLPARMGPTFLAVLMHRPVFMDLDDATRTARVRPVWAAGFAGSPSGFQGSAATTIAIIDSGVDGTHPDLSGRCLYWKDWFGGSPNPVDYTGHGTLAAAIACGTGGVLGATPTTLRLTSYGDLTGVGSGSFKPQPFHLPAGSVSLSLTATWLGGGNGKLGYAYADDGTNSYTIGGSTVSGSSPRSGTWNFSATSNRHYSVFFTKNTAGDNITKYAVAGSMTYAGVGDGFNALSGVAPGCNWVAHKVYANDGSGGDTGTIGYALDECVAYNTTYNIKVVNLSLSTADPHSPTRNKANSCVENGIVVTCSAGNTGPAGVMTDPGRASKVITAVASSDGNMLTSYSSTGNFTQEWNTDYKPDIAPPGGSNYWTYMTGADSNQSDAQTNTFADVYANDYASLQGTSMSAPFAAGAAALVIQALEAGGLTWNYYSDAHPRLVKMLLCATATETNANREGGSNNPTLGRAAAPKDMYEGYGVLNCDAAIEAAYQTMAPGETITGSTTGARFDRRAWARKIAISSGQEVRLNLTVPGTADYDLYLYSGTPDAKGNPVILAASATAGNGTAEGITYTPSASGTAYVVVKRISGSGSWALTYVSSASIVVTSPNGGEVWRMGSSYDITWTYSGSAGTDVRIELLKGGAVHRTIVTSTPIGSGGSGSYTWSVPTDLTAASDYRVRVSSVSASGVSDDSNGNFTIARILTALTTDDASGRPGETVSLRATLRDAGGTALSGKTVSFSVSGTTVGSAATGGDGVATLAYAVPDNLGAGAKTVRGSFAGDALYEPSQGDGTLTINQAATTLYTVNRTGTITETVTLRQYDLKRTTDNALLSGKTIVYRVAGTQVGTAQTDAGGDSLLNWVITDGAATRSITVEFAGEAVYGASSASATLTCQSWGTKMATFDRTARITDRTELKCRLLRSDNTPLYNKTINFYVDGTFVISRPTNVDGYASYPYYDVPDGSGAGERTILSEWPGNGGYAAISKTARLTVLKAIPYIWVMPRSVPKGQTARLYVYFRRLYDYTKQEGKTVTWRIDGTVIGQSVTGVAESGEPGVARFNYDTSGLSLGSHTVRCEWAGDAWVDAGYGQGNLTIY